MKTSPAGRALIEQREGRRLSAYRDTRGVWTIGVGHTGRMSLPEVTAGMTITDAQADAFLAADLAPVETVINAAVKVPISQNEFDALASLGFNIGAAGLRGSTVIRKLNLGDIEGAAAAVMLWDKPAVLISRREAERAQFLAPDASPRIQTQINSASTGGAINTASMTMPSPSIAVAQSRAVILAAKSDEAKSSAKAPAASAAVGVAMSGAVATGAAWHGLPSWALVAGAVVLVGAIIDGTVVWARMARAATLSVNATKQAAVATNAGPGSIINGAK